MPDNSNKRIHFTLGKSSDLGGGRPKELSWAAFKLQFAEEKVLRSPETLAAYLALSKDEQTELKAKNGWWFRSQTDGKRRTSRSAEPSDLIHYDFDDTSPELYEGARDGTLKLRWEYCFHTTRRHRPESRRFRMVLPVSKPIPNELYLPVSRIAASFIDPSMDFVDPASFRTGQMMYKPTVCIDGEYVFRAHEGELLDWEDLLEQFDVIADWRDINQLPRRKGEILRESAEKMENPTEKPGPVGWFCQAYTVMKAIDAFDLPYIESDAYSAKPRYTYTGGTTTNGAEVQDGGLYLTSYHSSDPVGDRTVNAFDLVRIHMFGDFAENEGPGTPMAHRQSFKAMLNLIKDDPECRKYQLREKHDELAMYDHLDADDWDEVQKATDREKLRAAIEEVIGPVDGDEEDNRPQIELTETNLPIRIDHAKRRPKPPKDWMDRLARNQNGDILSTLPNFVEIITNDPRLHGTLAFNEFDNRPVVVIPIKHKFPNYPQYPLRDRLSGDPYDNETRVLIKGILAAESGKGKAGWGVRRPSNDDLEDAVLMVSRKNTFNPVREVLESFTHDGVERVTSLFIRYLGCPDQPYYRDAARLFLIAAVGRIYEPGLKFDYMPVLYGAQGVRKSTFIKTLALNWYGELAAKFDDRQELAEQMLGKWIMECAELASLIRSQIEDVKAFLSATDTFVRMPYHRQPTLFRRQTVFMSSTNNDDFLRDTTGNRRFWPIPVSVESIDTDDLGRNVAQIWAEAVVMYKVMRAEHPHGELPLYMTGEADAAAKAHQDSVRRRDDTDLLAEAFMAYLDAKEPDDFDGHSRQRRERVTTLEMVGEVEKSGIKLRISLEQAISQALQKAGWVKETDADGNRVRPRIEGHRVQSYVPGPKVLGRWTQEDGTDDADDVI